MSEALEWSEVSTGKYEARRGPRHYVVCKQSVGDSGNACAEDPPPEQWIVSGFARPDPDVDTEDNLGEPVLRPTLDEAKQQAQWWESEQKLWHSA